MNDKKTVFYQIRDILTPCPAEQALKEVSVPYVAVLDSGDCGQYSNRGFERHLVQMEEMALSVTG